MKKFRLQKGDRVVFKKDGKHYEGIIKNITDDGIEIDKNTIEDSILIIETE